jgi:predicted nucleic acid-binding protein
MTAVFLDTVGVIAVWDKADQWHELAALAYQQLLKQDRQLVTTQLVLVECGNAAARRPYRRRVNALRAQLAQDQLLIELTFEDFEQAWEAYDRGEAAEAGIVDHVSFVVMRRLGITDAFTHNHHFSAAGFNTLF